LRERPAYDWVAETSIYVERSMHRCGLGERIYAALLHLLAMQGLVWAYGGISVASDASELGPSQRFHARIGFEQFARFPCVGGGTSSGGASRWPSAPTIRPPSRSRFARSTIHRCAMRSPSGSRGGELRPR